MAKIWLAPSLNLSLSMIVCICLLTQIQGEAYERKAHIVYMGDQINPESSKEDVHLKMIEDVLGSNALNHGEAKKYLTYTFNNFRGFVAHLTEEEAEKMSSMDGVVSVFPSQNMCLHTTRSWDFMGFLVDVERRNLESDVIIGVIDTGIWPESESFSDEGLSPVPAKWKGTCDPSFNFTCNKKIIGARYLRSGYNESENEIPSPRDTVGHGTHTASIAAGRLVPGTSFLGLAEGTARGGVPSSRIAVYKPCWFSQLYTKCNDADILAAFDTAISDGVDIISVSLGRIALPYFEDSMAIGAFHATMKGILVSTSAGNYGPHIESVVNVAPWSLTVAASSIDRSFITHIKLDNGMFVQGISLNTFDSSNNTFPIIYGRNAQSNWSTSSSRFCYSGSLNKTLVKGKIVVCDTWIDGETPFTAGAAGVIMQGSGPLDYPSSYPIPASYIEVDDGGYLPPYPRISTSLSYGTILKSVASNDTSSPRVVSFSSRGPNAISRRILKPDLTAPGVAILAAYSPLGTVSEVPSDPRSVRYNMLSGTSMSCPHATAIAAYVKSFHPTWSPAAIKSALMTSASQMSSAVNEEAEFAYGSGHINPSKAVNPGLVYDAEEDDYINFLCSEGLNETLIRLITGNNQTHCPLNKSGFSNSDLNYPSMALAVGPSGTFDAVFRRTVTNVGAPNSTYTAMVTRPEGQDMTIKVRPNVLLFDSLIQKLSFTVRVSGSIGLSGLMSASLVWDDGQHLVRSPIVVYNSS